MTMLKKIYSEGDDEMKRTINKAWSESQEKKVRGGGEDMMMDLWAAPAATPQQDQVRDARDAPDMTWILNVMRWSQIYKSYFHKMYKFSVQLIKKVLV